MKTVYEASNSIEAHMILHLLQQQGVSAQIQGEHLMGALGELPAAGLVRVVVDDVHYPQARDAIAHWDAAQPEEPTPRSAVRKPNTTRTFMLGLLIGIACSYAYFQSPIKVDGVDHNGDGEFDEKWTYAPSGRALKTEVDRNLDGKIDYIIHNDHSGLIETAEADDNFDGNFETRNSFLRSNVDISEADTDGDGFRDLRWRHINGVLSTAEFVSPVTFRPLRIEHFVLGKLTSAEIDSNMDGILDTRHIYNPLGEVSAREKLQ